ncbi:DEAD/DEAH box helicase [Portibacter lacus]
MTFRDLNLNKSLIKALDDLKITHPTSIQEKAFSTIMSGRDMIGIAQTGTGKTFAYLLPSLRLWKYSKERFPQILIIVPTRELVVQVVEEVEKLSAYTNLVVVGAYGGANIKPQVAAVEAGSDVVVATPGRLLDLCLKGALKLKNIKKFIIDEVDEMLNLGFLPQLKRILEYLPEKRQNLLFSATMTEEVEAIILDFFNRPVKIEAAPMGTPLENIDQSLYYVKNFNTKVNLLKDILSDSEEFNKVLIFTSTKKFADKLFDELDPTFPEQIGVIHSNKSQNYRFNSVNSFTSGEYRLLIATDIVARGIDVSEVSHVINFDIPDEAENYIHRIGRTGRADKKGIAISLVTETEEEYLANIEALMKFAIPLNKMPEHVEISDVLIDEELPKIIMKNVVVPRATKAEAGAAFHEKKDKNKKTNQKLNRAEKMKLKYKKPIKRGAKNKKKKR